jgi:hypothetical protein
MLLYIAHRVYTFGYEYILFRRLHKKKFRKLLYSFTMQCHNRHIPPLAKRHN